MPVFNTCIQQLCHYVHKRCDTSTYKEFNKLIDKFNYFVSGVKRFKNWSAWVTFANGFNSIKVAP